MYRDRDRASLVTSYGDYIGLYPLKDIVYVSDEPLFKKSDYSVGDIIIWVDGEDIYEGEIVSLYDPYARTINIKKLMPVDHVANVAYWKISEGRKSTEESALMNIRNIVGEDLNNRGE